MSLLLAALAVTASALLLGWIGLRDPKRLRAQDAPDPAPRPFSSRERRFLALGAVAPGLVLMMAGWWPSAVMWLGGTVTLAWLWVLWLARRRTSSAATRE